LSALIDDDAMRDGFVGMLVSPQPAVMTAAATTIVENIGRI
jgi:hypothetical protein